MDQQEIIGAILVLLTAITGIWKAVPLGLIIKLHPAIIFLMTASGATISVFILYFFGNKVKRYLLKPESQSANSKKGKRIKKILNKYGPAGLGIIGTLIAGQITTVLVGLALVKSQRKFLVWMIVGSVFASFCITMLGVFSVDLFKQISESLKLF
jgi:membrane protein DedA with SNARE-associated domain